MKRMILGLALVSGSLLAAVPAQAQAWQSINQRQANLDARIDMGVRNGSLTRQEAILLRGDFRTLVNLEANYRRTRPGLTLAERRDLDRRFDALSRRVYAQRHDRQDNIPNGWQSINQRQANLDRRIDMGVRNGGLTRREAILLRGEFRTLVNLEARYRRTGNGLTLAERRDLDRRFDALSRRIRTQRHDRQGS